MMPRAMLYRNIFLSGTDNPKLKQSNVRPLSELGLPVRIENCLIHGGGITSIDQLLMQTEEQLLKCPNLGEKSILEIKSIVSSKGLVWAANQVKS